MTQYFTDWTEYPSGAQPSDWTRRWDTSMGTWLVQAGAGYDGVKPALQTTYGASQTRLALSWNVIDSDPDRADVEFVYRWRPAVYGNNDVRTLARGSGNGTSETGYNSGFVNGGSRTSYMLNGGSFTIASTPVSGVVDPNWVWTRVRITGTTDLKVRTWIDGTDEPTVWDVESTTATSITDPGWVGLTSYVDGSGTLTWDFVGIGTGGDPAPTSPVPPPDPTPVAEWIANYPAYCAHRGGSADWVEMTMDAYDHAAAWGVPALEISVWPSSDGVWVGSHDKSTLRMTGTDWDITAHTWAELSTLRTTVGGFPLCTLTELLDKYGSDHIIFIDNKGVLNLPAFTSLLNTYPDSTGRFVWKNFYTASSYAAAAHAAGYKTWGYYYAADAPNLPSTAGNWDYLGMQYDAGQSVWDQVLSYGKPALAHIIATATQAVTALATGASGLMVSGVTEVIPQTGLAVTVYADGVETAATVAVLVDGAEVPATIELAP